MVIEKNEKFKHVTKMGAGEGGGGGKSESGTSCITPNRSLTQRFHLSIRTVILREALKIFT